MKPGRWIPRIELVRFKRIDFFPPPVQDWSRLSAICIATKSRNLGDALALTTLPEKLKQVYPGLRVTTYPRAFNPVVFAGNPHVDSVQYLPDAVYGDDTNAGSGQLIQLKETFFELPISTPPHPKIYLREREKREARAFLNAAGGTDGRPWIAIHPWGHTRSRVLESQEWEGIVASHRARYRFLQVGVEGHERIPGCERYLLLPRRFHAARRLFAVLSEVQGFIGVDSAPMHVARAFDIPSLIFVGHLDPERVLKERGIAPYFLGANYLAASLYAENRNSSPENATEKAADFLGSLE